jgi:RNA polymerase sigma factor (TIGR02999 family)
MKNGSNDASEALYARVYDELRCLARVVRSDGAPATLNTTALVHEAYLHLRPDNGLDVESRRHFFRLAARAMRQVIARFVRHRSAQKRGGDAVTISFESHMFGERVPIEEVITLEEALAALEAMHERQARIVECRFYAGFSVEETARILDVSPSTVKRDWRAAKAWLRSQLCPQD